MELKEQLNVAEELAKKLRGVMSGWRDRENQGLIAKVWEGHGNVRVYVSGYHRSGNYFLSVAEDGTIQVIYVSPGDLSDIEAHANALGWRVEDEGPKRAGKYYAVMHIN